jgi:hypothetical protein
MARQVAIIAALVLLLTACATQPPATASAPGFLLGLYAFPNTGLGYDAGFMLGAAVVIGVVCSQ